MTDDRFKRICETCRQPIWEKAYDAYEGKHPSGWRGAHLTLKECIEALGGAIKQLEDA